VAASGACQQTESLPERKKTILVAPEAATSGLLFYEFDNSD
jgi:hypothetical protein